MVFPTKSLAFSDSILYDAVCKEDFFEICKIFTLTKFKKKKGRIMVNTHKEKKTYTTPETEIILFGEDIIATSGNNGWGENDYDLEIDPNSF